MGIKVKNYKIGGSSSSIVCDVYVQCGRQPIAIQRKKILNDPDPKWEVIYVALAYANPDEAQPICAFKSAQVEITTPLWESPYMFVYGKLKEYVTSQGYEYEDEI